MEEQEEERAIELVQKVDFKKGNEMAAIAARQINYHLMGYFPITPSTEIAEEVDEMYADGEHQIRMVPADGEHGAAGICYGATLGGGRVLNATSAQGLLYAMEQLPVQSGTRFPMVLNVVTRSVSGHKFTFLIIVIKLLLFRGTSPAEDGKCFIKCYCYSGVVTLVLLLWDP
nr:hypothetical protein [Candidatus Hakubella thermalkaliphila]